MTGTLPTLPTSVVGSHGLPGWVWLAREAMEAGRLGQSDVRELMEDATLVALADQERAGVDVLVYRGDEISRKGDGGPTCLTRPLLRD